MATAITKHGFVPDPKDPTGARCASCKLLSTHPVHKTGGGTFVKGVATPTKRS
jgi:hypothetical protein